MSPRINGLRPMTAKPTLTIIQSTHASLDGAKSVGLLDRQRRVLQAYRATFDVVIYSADTANYSEILGVEHRPVPWLPRVPGLRHLAFYLWLVLQAPKMRGLIKVVGSNIPTLPLVKSLAHRPMLVGYSYDYASQTQLGTHNPIQWLLAPWMERLALSPADLVLVSAEWLGQKVRSVYHKPTLLLPNWVDVPDFGGALQERDHWLIVFAGRLHWTKGANRLIEAFAPVKRQFPTARLVICGHGEQMAALRAQVAELDLADVELRGPVPHPEVLRLMGRAGIFVLPTLTMEGHPKALIEAMASGAAIVATDVPGNRDDIHSGSNGLLVPPDDAAALAAAMGRLLADDALCAALGRQAALDAQQYAFGPIVRREVEALLAYPAPAGS
ncbi:MAG: glycosyltransferase family 4 protein [Anaerolineales bacterium]